MKYINGPIRKAAADARCHDVNLSKIIEKHCYLYVPLQWFRLISDYYPLLSVQLPTFDRYLHGSEMNGCAISWWCARSETILTHSAWPLLRFPVQCRVFHSSRPTFSAPPSVFQLVWNLLSHKTRNCGAAPFSSSGGLTSFEIKTVFHANLGTR